MSPARLDRPAIPNQWQAWLDKREAREPARLGLRELAQEITVFGEALALSVLAFMRDFAFSMNNRKFEFKIQGIPVDCKTCRFLPRMIENFGGRSYYHFLFND